MPAPLLTASRSAVPLLTPPPRSIRRPLVAVFLGTDHHPFDRVLSWAGELAAHDDNRWFVQHGFTGLPSGLDGADILSVQALGDLLRRADAVVTHAGPGLIMEARQAGHQPIVVPRDASRGEHVDDHQVRFAEHIAGTGLVSLARDRTQFQAVLHETLQHGRSTAPVPQRSTDVSARFGELVDRVVRHAS